MGGAVWGCVGVSGSECGCVWVSGGVLGCVGGGGGGKMFPFKSLENEQICDFFGENIHSSVGAGGGGGGGGVIGRRGCGVYRNICNFIIWIKFVFVLFK